MTHKVLLRVLGFVVFMPLDQKLLWLDTFMFSRLFLHVNSKSQERHEGIPSNLAQIHTFTQKSLTVFV